MPHTGPLTRVTNALDSRRDREHRRPVDGTSVRLGALLVFLTLIVLMVLTASPSMAATSDPTPGAWAGVINLAPILFWAAVAIGVTVRIVLGRRTVRRESTTAAHVVTSRAAATRPESSRPVAARPVASRPVASRPVASRSVSSRPGESASAA